MACQTTQPKAVVFDLGKVLVEFDYSIAARRIVSRCNRPIDHHKFFTEHAPLLCRYELGLLTTPQFFEAMQAASGFTGSSDEFGTFFADIFTPIPDMVDLHSRLKQAGFPTYIFSNTNELAVDHIRRQFPFFSRFDDYIYSYHHGSMKPDAKLYEVVESVTRCAGKDIVYIDDRFENIATASSRNWRALHHTNTAATITTVENYCF